MPNSDLVDLRTYILPTYRTILSFSCSAVQTFVLYLIPCWYGISEFLKWPFLGAIPGKTPEDYLRLEWYTPQLFM